MKLLDGINHVAIVTSDIDRMVDFYTRVFGASVALDMKEERLRIVLIEVGPSCLLAAFQIEGGEPLPGGLPQFQRGRHDHVCLNAASEDGFRELRRRAVAEGASDGIVIDVGPAMQFKFTDPDGFQSEVIWVKPGIPWDTHLRPADWQVIEMD